MRTRLLSGTVAALVLGTLLLPATAQASAPPSAPPSAPVMDVRAHGAAAGTAVASGYGEPGTRLHVEAGRTASARWLEIAYQVQETGYWCGPAATRIALSARTAPPSQAALAAQLGTTQAGTDHIGQITRVLNARLGTGWYETKEMPNDPPTPAQRDLLWHDIVFDIDRNYPLVANIVAPPGNQPPGYPPGQTIYHYFTVFGYDAVDRTVLIADPASFGGNQIYWLSFDQLASLIPPKGYSA
ncbi:MULTISPECIES: C39 family peptidase [Streptomyces]|uniref:C39 family peptidase n=1 Tax=Streptomyces TaxID=1883 RepID=UPI00103C5A0B|nr:MULTISPECIES: C39 family peptidase [Streptomyces]MBT3075013.1 C39 family peptidase [Streptomyces sp. COG21]MBT3089026.1 C39 family peptidase [Streptomyces sp. CYG21]MBT3097841.1 C39 family peptidase [Streptomyces sp. CBG30]MBT3103841.1 C39 family peptidase [Streptomyces sp. COG19]MBT3113248.1 C39 family peptidase [Streptomyces sp. CYG20]